MCSLQIAHIFAGASLAVGCWCHLVSSGMFGSCSGKTRAKQQLFPQSCLWNQKLGETVPCLRLPSLKSKAMVFQPLFSSVFVTCLTCTFQSVHNILKDVSQVTYVMSNPSGHFVHPQTCLTTCTSVSPTVFTISTLCPRSINLG